ncbi:hypothetical protein C440_10338 [Haloferax mucosum ATCC BAA-1512]|uniref:Metallo-beta-lactamase domain-containing protein n=1 Tax=Haloferax mucosum ATCC BAA-1512 TaxID=662479 RepID=M0IB92_9EURY|nr:MBL fold metallo-hydrolase [Haloferax mucosum]ELZ94011.1 hypothetical protein C440_10338 [Haloferax mucosum ATCC BAA-1512]
MVTPLSDGLWHIDCKTFDMPNVFLVDDGTLTLVDSGWPSDEETVRNGVVDAGFELADIDRILLTHYDADHVGTLGRLSPDLDASVYIHEFEAPYVTGERLPPWTARNGLEAMHRLYYRRIELPDLPIRPIGDGDTIGEFRVYHTPGHTPGHVTYVHEGRSAAFLGDLAYGLGDTLRPTGRLSSYDAQQVKTSIQSLLRRGDRFTHACPGHGPPLENGYERLSKTVE